MTRADLSSGITRRHGEERYVRLGADFFLRPSPVIFTSLMVNFRLPLTYLICSM